MGCWFQRTVDKHLGIRIGKEPGEKPGKNGSSGEETRETQKVAQEPANPSGADGHNPCKPKTTMIPKVILEDPQMQLY